MRLRNIPKAKPAIEESPLCIKNPKDLKGQWKLSVSSNMPINIEIGMGKGQFLIQMAEENPGIFFLGIERYESVIYRALQKLEELDATGTPRKNLALLCHPAEEIEEMFAPGEIDRIYLNFSDPWPKERHAKRRLTSPKFLDCYAGVLKLGGYIEFKTDNVGLFAYSVEQLEIHPAFSIVAKTFDLHKDVMMNYKNVMTEYEEKFAAEGKKICKLVAQRVDD